MAHASHHELLQKIGQNIGVELTFDDADQCVIMLDDRLVISIRAVDSAWICYGMLGSLEADELNPRSDSDDSTEADILHQLLQEDHLPRQLLEMNLTLAEVGGGVISVQKDTGVIMLVQRVPLADSNVGIVEEALKSFANQLEAVIHQLDGIQADTAFE